MISTRALEKVTQYLKRKKIKEFDVKIENGIGLINVMWDGIKYEVTIKHGTNEIMVRKSSTEWL